jgi:hypothetical protein
VAQQPNKFSAALDDEDVADESMDTADDEETKERESKSTPTFSAPEGFSFANAMSIAHKNSGFENAHAFRTGYANPARS